MLRSTRSAKSSLLLVVAAVLYGVFLCKQVVVFCDFIMRTSCSSLFYLFPTNTIAKYVGLLGADVGRVLEVDRSVPGPGANRETECQCSEQGGSHSD